MKFKSLLFIGILGLIFSSCEKKNVEKTTETTKVVEVAKVPTVKIDTIMVSDKQMGFGCVTSYHKVGDLLSEIYVETSTKDEKGWVSFLKINGKHEEFYSKGEEMDYGKDEDHLIKKLENDQYQVVIDIKLGEVNIEADATAASGTIKIVDKKTKAETVIKIEGGTAC